MNTRTRFPLKRVGGLSALAGAVTLGVSLFASQTAIAGGNPHFEGIISAAPPTGFMSSPNISALVGGHYNLTFNDEATNLTGEPHSIALNFSAHHILTYNGVDVSDGQPGQPGITFTGPTGTTQVLMPGTQSFTETWTPHGTQSLALTYDFTTCGYYQVDVWAPIKPTGGKNRATLASAFIRVLGCDEGPTPTPSLTPTPSSTPSSTPTASPSSTPSGGVGGATSTPSGGVQGITSTPTTGAGGGGWLTIGAALVIGGLGMLVVGVRGRRIDI